MSSKTLSPQTVPCSQCKIIRTKCRLIHIDNNDNVVEETGDQHPTLCYTCTTKAVVPMRELPGPLRCPFGKCGLRIEDPCSNDFTGFFLMELAPNNRSSEGIVPILGATKVNKDSAVDTISNKLDAIVVETKVTGESVPVQSLKKRTRGAEPVRNNKRKPTDYSTLENESDSFRMIKKRITDAPKNRAPRRRRCQFITKYPHTCVQFLKVKRTKNGGFFCPDHFDSGDQTNEIKTREEEIKLHLKRCQQILAVKRAEKRTLAKEAKLAIIEAKCEEIDEELGDDCEGSGNDSEEESGDDCYDNPDDYEEELEDTVDSVDNTN